MICIYCFHGKTDITNSRGHAKDAATWRRHSCPHCGRVFSTIERPVMADTYRIGGQPYSHTRLSASLMRAFGHLSGDSRYQTVDWLIGTIEKAIVAQAHDAELAKNELGALIYGILKNYDVVASVQYAAQNGLVAAISKRRRGRPSLG